MNGTGYGSNKDSQHESQAAVDLADIASCRGIKGTQSTVSGFAFEETKKIQKNSHPVDIRGNIGFSGNYHLLALLFGRKFKVKQRN